MSDQFGVIQEIGDYNVFPKLTAQEEAQFKKEQRIMNEQRRQQGQVVNENQQLGDFHI